MMRDKVTIAYRGASYELGRGRDYYALWAAGTPRSEPVERWPETPDGWAAAWTRFTAVEAPGTITPAQRGSRASGLFAGGSVASGDTPGGDTPGGDKPGLGAAAGSATYVMPAATDTETLPAADEPAALDTEALPVAGPQAGGGTFAQPVIERKPKPRAAAPIAAGLLVIGVIFGVAGLFPSYVGTTSVASQPPLLVTHVAALAGWTIAALLILLGGIRQRAGALVAGGLSVVTIGLLVADTFNATTSHASLGAGTWLGLAGWLFCAAGAALALRLGSLGRISRPRGADLARAGVVALAGIATAIAFAPAWDSYLLRTASGQSATVTAGNAFSSPGLVIAANVAVMVLFALLVAAAALWRPVQLGSMLLAGAVLPMAAQAVSALVQVSEPTSPTVFGYTQAQAAAAGLTISNGVTAVFWIFCVLVVVLIVAFAWMLITPHAIAAAAGPATVPVEAAADDEGREW